MYRALGHPQARGRRRGCQNCCAAPGSLGRAGTDPAAATCARCLRRITGQTATFPRSWTPNLRILPLVMPVKMVGSRRRRVWPLVRPTLAIAGCPCCALSTRLLRDGTNIVSGGRDLIGSCREARHCLARLSRCDADEFDSRTPKSSISDPIAIIGGVAIHTETHHAAALDSIGTLLGTEEFTADQDGQGSCCGGSHRGGG